MIYLERIFNNIKLSYPTIKLIKNASKINYNINFIIAGLNLAYLGYYGLGKIEINNDTFHWPDGIFKNRFFDKKIPKSAGRNFFSSLVFSNSIKNIYILGELSEKTILYLKNKFIGKNLIHIDLPYDTSEKIFKKIEHIRYSKNDIVILTLPTPKQEQVANLIAKSNEYYKIFCLGGALAMLSGTEKPVPLYLDRLGLEFMWRIKNDPYRRTVRLFTTFISYILNEFRGKYRSLKTETYFE
jgi:UDP-N-acetyl-D-mannosaminuronic acid transferase (WecB/TagA/CpsF family)